MWWAALLALVALVGLGIWASTRGGSGAGSPTAAQPAPVRVALVFAKPVGSPLLSFGHGPEAIYRATPTGGDPVRLARGADPAISQDGRWVVYRRDTRAQLNRLFVINSIGGTPRRLPGSSDEPVVWSPDSRLVAATGSGTGHRNHRQRAFGQVASSSMSRRPATASRSHPTAPSWPSRTAPAADRTSTPCRRSSGAIRRLTDDGQSFSPLWDRTGSPSSATATSG